MTNSNNTIRFSVRIYGKSTSFTLKKNVVSLWIVQNGLEDENLREKVLGFIFKCIKKWDSSIGKGISPYITNCMIEDILGKDDFGLYLKVFSKLE